LPEAGSFIDCPKRTGHNPLLFAEIGFNQPQSCTDPRCFQAKLDKHVKQAVAFSPSLRIATGLLLAALLSIVGYQVFLHTSSAPEALLKQADDFSWLNSWIAAEPLYHGVELDFLQKHALSKALFGRVSQIPAQSESSTATPNQPAMLRHDLELPATRDPETRLSNAIEVARKSNLSEKTPWTHSTQIGNAALAVRVQDQRAPRLRADGYSKIESSPSQQAR